MGFPHSSVGKESACNAGDPGSIPGLGRSAGEEIGYSLQYSWASLVGHLVKNLPVMSLLFSAICKASSDNHFVFLHFCFLGMVLTDISPTASIPLY